MIRRLTGAEIGDLRWVSRLHGPQFGWSLEQLIDLSLSHEFWGLIDGEHAIAFVALIRLPEAWEIPVLATHPDQTRRGKMRRLLEEVFAAKQHEMDFWLEVHEDNAPARSLYEALGFQLEGRRPRYYSDGRAALLLTRKKPT